MSFIDQMIKQAQADVRRIVLPEATDPRVLAAAQKLSQEKIADILLVGETAAIEEAAKAGNFDVSACQIIDINNHESKEAYVEAFYEMRKHKGIDLEQAAEQLKNPVYYGMVMVKQGDADGLVSGAVNSTADTLRPALQIVKTDPSAKLVSAFFLMVVPNSTYGEDGVFVFADCGLNENPTAEQLAEIAISSAGSFTALTGKEAKVAMLSYSTKGSAKSDLTEKVIEATKLAQEKAPELILDGELQVDAALEPSVASSKAPDSKLEGRANVLVFPDLNSGNIGYKLVQRLAGAEAYGPLTQGIAKPVNDLSRGCSTEDIVGVVAITAVQAQNAK